LRNLKNDTLGKIIVVTKKIIFGEEEIRGVSNI
jgi:uncharacterized protein (DUF433 family)